MPGTNWTPERVLRAHQVAVVHHPQILKNAEGKSSAKKVLTSSNDIKNDVDNWF